MIPQFFQALGHRFQKHAEGRTSMLLRALRHEHLLPESIPRIPFLEPELEPVVVPVPVPVVAKEEGEVVAPKLQSKPKPEGADRIDQS
jgi:hypothetical protein